MAVEVGNNAPDFNLPADNSIGGGKNLTFADYAGKSLLLYFYPKDDTSGCTQQANDFRDRLAEFAQYDCAVVGISKDSVKSHDKFSEKYQLNFPLLADTETIICQAYGVWVEKSMYGRKYMGVERSSFLIDGQGKIIALWRKVKVPNHVQQVLETLQQFAAK